MSDDLAEIERERRLEDLKELRDQSMQEERQQEQNARDVSHLPRTRLSILRMQN